MSIGEIMDSPAGRRIEEKRLILTRPDQKGIVLER